MPSLLSKVASPNTENRVAGLVEVSIVMPCLNEAETVAKCVTKAIRALQELGVSGEVIVADNGSTDGSPTLAEEAGARVVRVSRQGYGAALQGGIDLAHGMFIIIGDADNSYDFSRIEGFVSRLRDRDDLVMGNRFKGGILPGAMPWHHRYFGNPLLTGLLNLFYHSGVGDAHCGLRAFRKDAYDRLDLRTPGMEFASEMVVKAVLKGLKISEIPVVLHPDGRSRRPHLRSFRDGWRHLQFLLMFCPLWAFIVPAGLLCATGLGLMIWLTGGAREVGTIELGVHTMLLGALCTILGYQTLCMGFFGKVLGIRSGMLAPDRITCKLSIWLTPERGLLLGSVMFLAGLGMNLWLVSKWWQMSFGELQVQRTLRFALWGLTGMALGLQTAYGSFFLGLLNQWVAPPQGSGQPAPRPPP